jgi:hypothetical protein
MGCGRETETETGIVRAFRISSRSTRSDVISLLAHLYPAHLLLRRSVHLRQTCVASSWIPRRRASRTIDVRMVAFIDHLVSTSIVDLDLAMHVDQLPRYLHRLRTSRSGIGKWNGPALLLRA